MRKSIILILLIGLFLTGCVRVEDPDSIPTYTISFNTNNDVNIPDKTVFDGETLLDLPVPSLEGMDFIGWSYAQEMIVFPWLFDLQKDVTLTANYAHPEWEYLIEHDTIVITGYRGTDTHVVMPTSINGLPVFRIDNNAFEDNTTIQHLTIASTVALLGRDMFLNSSVRTIDFEENAAVTIFPNSSFYGAKQLESITIPRNVEIIGDGAFDHNEALRTIRFENGSKLREIQMYAFNRTGIETVTLPASLEIIGYWAFADCYNLVSVYFENNHNIHTIGRGAFAYSLNLSTFTFPSGVSVYPSYLLRGNTAIKHMVLPEGVEVIEENAFYLMDALETVTMPKTVTRIEAWAFPWLPALTEVIFMEPSQLTVIETFAFFTNPSLKKIIIPMSVTTIENFAFYHNNELVLYMRHSERPATWAYSFYQRAYWTEEETLVWNYKD